MIVTPSADGFTTTTTTLANVSTDGLFVTDWNAVVTDGKLSAIAIVGEKAAAYTDGSGTVTPDPTDEGTLVYLDSNAKAIVRAAAYGKSWLVVSDRSAYALPTGEEIGVIYREYSTYEEATKAAAIDLMIVGGHWYRIDENGKILSDASDITYETLPVVSLDGYQKITMIGNNSGSNWTGNVSSMFLPIQKLLKERLPVRIRMAMHRPERIMRYRKEQSLFMSTTMDHLPITQIRKHRVGPIMVFTDSQEQLREL